MLVILVSLDKYAHSWNKIDQLGTTKTAALANYVF